MTEKKSRSPDRLRQRAYQYIKQKWFIFFAILVYGFFTFYYLGPSILSCATTVYGFGDNTAGPIWQASLPEKQGPIGSYTAMTNAPYGDNLENPIAYSLVAQTVLIQGLTTVAGPVCGYNIANMLGFMLSALVMFGFILAVTRKRWIALLAGYAVSFAPYYQLKIGAHFSFGFQAIFIGILWSFYNLMKKRRKRDAVLLAGLFALAMYWDPYYTILAALIIAPLGLVWLLLNRRILTPGFWRATAKATDVIKKQFQLLMLSLVAVALLLMPLVYVFLTQGKDISNNVSASRGNVLLETQYCSNWPHEYLVPFMYNPVLEKAFGADLYHTSVNVLRDHYSCGIGEDIVGLSITITLIAVLGLTVMLWDRLSRRRTNLSKLLGYEPKILIYGLLAILVAALLLSLPPMTVHGIPTPSYVLLEITPTWRTITRIFVIVNIVVVALAAIAMAYLYKNLRLKGRVVLSAVLLLSIFGLTLVEYQTAKRPFTGNDFGTFSYTESVPAHYGWLKQQESIKTIAEYPLERSGGEGNSMAYYLSMQSSHDKKLFNGAVSYSEHEKKKAGLKNLYDPQTLPVLKAMGVDAVVVHGLSREQVEKIPNSYIMHEANPTGFTVAGFSPLVKYDQVFIIGIGDVAAQQYVVAPGEGFFRSMDYVKSAVDWRYLSGSDSKMSILSLDSKPLSTPQNVCFMVSVVGDEPATLVISSKQTELKRLVITKDPVRVELVASESIDLVNAEGVGMVVSGIGCQ